VGLEGELRVGLRVRDAQIDRIGITSTRPDVARALLQGRLRAEAVAAVPRLFSICGHSQAAASQLACAAAAGETLNPEMLASCAASVDAEMVREYAWRLLLDGPRWIGENPTDEAIAAARASLAFRMPAPTGSHASDAAHQIAIAAFGMSADDWLGLHSLPDLDRWADAGRTATARWIRRLRDEDASGAQGARAAATTALLDGEGHAAWIGELSAACDADPEFARLPTWRGAPAETGALARQHAEPLIDALLHRSASPVPARFVARLRELALRLAGRATAAVGAMALTAGGGIAWVENARGLLVHQVRLAQDRVLAWRIVAPTEWNFHPAGALASALLGTPAADLEAVTRRTTQLVNSLDPCVACHVEFDNA
jgi:hypothetical protein